MGISPHIAGGLRNSLLWTHKRLMKHEVEVIFVVPKAYGDEDQSAVRLVNASDIVVDPNDTEFKGFVGQDKIYGNFFQYYSLCEFRRVRGHEN
jgi:hypothetical protein